MEAVAPGIDERNPALILEACDTGEHLWALSRRCLSENQFTAIWLRYKEDLSIRDIGHVMNKSRTHVKVLLYRGREKLAKTLTADKSETAPHTSVAMPGPAPVRMNTRISFEGGA
jgi:RNA polymerase sigma-70 factor (ECF subfamily)